MKAEKLRDLRGAVNLLRQVTEAATRNPEMGAQHEMTKQFVHGLNHMQHELKQSTFCEGTPPQERCLHFET